MINYFHFVTISHIFTVERRGKGGEMFFFIVLSRKFVLFFVNYSTGVKKKKTKIVGGKYRICTAGGVKKGEFS